MRPLYPALRWTITWDVFKSILGVEGSMSGTGWTITWDVFKFASVSPSIGIESRWTITWDVFKSDIS